MKKFLKCSIITVLAIVMFFSLDSTISKAADDLQVKVHYHRFDANYTEWNLWLWGEGMDGAAYYSTGTDDFGMVYEATIPDAGSSRQFGIIARLGEWQKKDVDKDRFVTTDTKNTDGVIEIYLVEGDETIYTDASQIDLSPRFKSAGIDSNRTITLITTTPFSISGEDAHLQFEIKDQDGNKIHTKTLIGVSGDTSNKCTIMLEDAITFDKKYTVSHPDYGTSEIGIGQAFGTKAFAESYTYDGDDLGATYSKDKTTFKLWAPTATKVVLNLFEEGSGDNAISSVDMTASDFGVWVHEESGDQNGVYYTYSVSVNGVVNEAVDPYARAAGVNGKRGMVIDLDTTDPEGWNEDVRPEFANFSDAIVYETHVRDFSIDESSGITNKGKYLGLTETGTVNSKGDSTGLDHLIDLGITHVQLIPVYDYYTVDESKLDTPQFNWGYDPQNYNLPEGSYSTDPTKGEVRITEFKEMVQTLHENDIRVIMDVVYNHTGVTGDSNFNLIVPNYYYRQNADGSYSNASGCGNETASERSMVSKFIVESVLYWVEEYHIDGFRFDLMGIHDIETMNLIREEINKIDPSIIIYGEGWTAGNSPLDESKRAVKKNTQQIDGIGAFSDDIRDGIKGGVFNNEESGFVSGASGKEEWIKFGVVGSIQNRQIDYSLVPYSLAPWANEPYQSVNYAEAHDNLTLWDRLATSNADSSEEDRIKMDKLAAAIVSTSQGINFYHLGQDFLRTKPVDDTYTAFDENSYKSSDFTNSIKWDRKSEYIDVYNYYKGLVAFRNAHPALRMNLADTVNANLTFMEDLASNMVGFTIANNANGDELENIIVVYNANPEAKTIVLPKGKWDVYANGEIAGTEVLDSIEETIDVAGISAIILAQGSASSPNPLPLILCFVSSILLITLFLISKKKANKK